MKRRSFLKRFGIGATATALIPAVLPKPTSEQVFQNTPVTLPSTPEHVFYYPSIAWGDGPLGCASFNRMLTEDERMKLQKAGPDKLRDTALRFHPPCS